MSHHLHLSATAIPIHQTKAPLLRLPSSPQDLVATTNISPRPTSLRARLSQLCRDGRPDLARLLFDSLPRPAPTILWNTLLIGYVCNALPHEALRLYALMNNSSHPDEVTRPDYYTFSSALKACADARQHRLGRSIHGHIIRRSHAKPKSSVLNNSLLNMYASTLDPSTRADVVRLLFERMPKRNVVAWNTIIAWYARSRRATDALEHFQRMMKLGIKLTKVSFVNVFPAVTAARCKKCADVLYGLSIKHGNEYADDLFVVSSAIFMYSELLDAQSARRVFDSAVQKNTEVWNTMIGGYIQNALFDDSLTLFIEMLRSEVVDADNVTFLAALMAVSQIQDVSLGQQIHAYLIKNSSAMALPLILSNALVVMYSRCGNIQLAFELFIQMSQKDVVSWNTMISAFVQNDMDFEGLLLVFEMQKEGFDVDSVTLAALLSAASNLVCPRIGKQTHGYLIRHGIEFEGMKSYLIDMYAKIGSIGTAWWLFNADRPDERDQVTWNAMIAGYAQSRLSEEALSLLRVMLEENQIPNSVTLSSVLPACNPFGGIQAGKQIHGFAIRRLLDSNVFVGTSLVDMYSKCGEIIFAERVFDRMLKKTPVTYTTMLSGLGQHGLGEKALTLFQEMKDKGVQPDAVTFVALISACSYSGLVDEGLAVFKSMEEFGVATTSEHYCCVVDLLGRAGRVEEAYQFVQELGDDGNVIGIWGSLLAACKVHRKVDLGKLVSDRLFDSGKDVAGYHVLLSNVYAAEGKWENVDRMRKEMREKGLRKEPGSSWVEVGEAVHRFMSREQKHPANNQIYTTLERLAFEMRGSGDKLVDPSLLDEISD